MHAQAIKGQPLQRLQPKEDQVKLNFNGAPRGNPSPAGEGEALKNNGGSLFIYPKFINRASNNRAELKSVIERFAICKSQCCHKIDMKEESTLLRDMLNRDVRCSN